MTYLLKTTKFYLTDHIHLLGCFYKIPYFLFLTHNLSNIYVQVLLNRLCNMYYILYNYYFTYNSTCLSHEFYK